MERRYDVMSGGRERLREPTPGGSVWPREACPAFSPRKGWLPVETAQCWYCRHADFHLTSSVALEVGICCYPQVQIE